MLVRLTIMVLRISALLALMLGILFWTGNARSLVFAHMVLGLLVTLSLWIVASAQAFTRRSRWDLVAGAVIIGAILPVFGMMQASLLPGSLHWIIQVIHLLLGLSAVGIGEVISRQARQLQTAPSARPVPS
jgi:uncharacterized membrane protein